MLVRKNVWELGSDWADPILWYARGVAAMQSRPINERSSWRFYAAIHGFHPELWQVLGYLNFSEPGPSRDEIRRFWRQCQHGSWYFLPWHRGYTLAFEATLRAAVVELGGPSDWTLPYWNYFKTGQNALPPAFASRDWPDGQGNNPLFIPLRYGPNGDGNVFVPLDAVNLEALSDPDFTGVDSGGSPGFGGVDTGFSHGGQVHGRLETQPHDWVHGLVGGSNESSPFGGGLMSNPDTAALDPIFWLHHANIDRLWQVWRQNSPTHVDPTEPNWVNGPLAVGERELVMPMPDGSAWSFTPAQMADLAALDYEYDDLSLREPPAEPFSDPIARRMAPRSARGAMATKKSTELVGANRGSLPVQGADIRTSVALNPEALRRVSASLFADAAVPDRVFLNLENVRGSTDAVAFRVYVGLPPGSEPEQHPEHQAGNIALFGVRKASLPTEEHGGEGLTFVLEITKVVDALQLGKVVGVDALEVRLVPVRPIAASAQVSIGRISISRQSSQ
jgi:tyrosinase